MVAIKASAIDSFLARPDPKAACILVYGPDMGLVHERAEALAKAGLDDPDDPFSLVRIEGDILAGDPGRLVDEATTSGLFGGRRAVWIRLGSRSVAPAVEALLAGPEPAARVVIEAGDLKKNAPIRTLCERNPRAAALPCYADGEAAIGRLIDAETAGFGLAISAEARKLLVSLLGADRMGSRNEIAKLCLYASDRGRIDVADVEAVIADSGGEMLDDAVDAAFTGDPGKLDRILTSLASAGVPASAAVGAALRHAQQLHRLRLDVEGGTAPAAVVERGWFGLHFRRKPAAERALGAWSSTRLENAIVRLSEAVLDGRRAGAFGEVMAMRTLAAIAAEARPRR
jgi:DNA polymerase-3 subunit delta